jgi:hypothetical protein
MTTVLSLETSFLRLLAAHDHRRHQGGEALFIARELWRLSLALDVMQIAG